MVQAPLSSRNPGSALHLYEPVPAPVSLAWCLHPSPHPGPPRGFQEAGMGRWVWLGEPICDSPHPSDLCYLPDLALPLSSCNIPRNPVLPQGSVSCSAAWGPVTALPCPRSPRHTVRMKALLSRQPAYCPFLPDTALQSGPQPSTHPQSESPEPRVSIRALWAGGTIPQGDWGTPHSALRLRLHAPRSVAPSPF